MFFCVIRNVLISVHWELLKPGPWTFCATQGGLLQNKHWLGSLGWLLCMLRGGDLQPQPHCLCGSYPRVAFAPEDLKQHLRSGSCVSTAQTISHVKLKCK